MQRVATNGATLHLQRRHDELRHRAMSHDISGEGEAVAGVLNCTDLHSPAREMCEMLSQSVAARHAGYCGLFATATVAPLHRYGGRE